jgi:hypothetical protein
VATNPPDSAPSSATTIEPSGTPAWFNLGRVGIGGGVYLGNGWVITAAHLDPNFNHQIIFRDDLGNGTTVQFDTSTIHTLSNAGIPNSTRANADLLLVRVAQDAANLAALNSLNLPTLNIATSTPTLGSGITMAGFGSLRGSSVKYNATPDTNNPGHFIWTQSPTGTFSGYQFDPGDNAPTEKRWGTNQTSLINGGITTLADNDNNQTETQVFGADFTDPTLGATQFESIGINHDSGGLVVSSTSPNTLYGVLLYRFAFTDQPDGTALYNNLSGAADLSAYSSQIASITGVPEPSTALALGGAATLLLRRRRSRK